MAQRQRKTPAERAQESLDVAQRLVEKLKTRHAKLYAEIEQVRVDLDQAIRRRDYALADPELSPQPRRSEVDAPTTAEAEDYEASKGMSEEIADAQQSGMPWEREPTGPYDPSDSEDANR